MRPFNEPSIVRLRVLPDEPDAAMPPRPPGSRRPHTDLKVAEVRRLIEDTPLTYGEIARRTGVDRASICRWTRDGGWQRHLFAPRATDTVPGARAGARLKRRMLAARLDALAERHIRELEESACVDPDKLGEALELLKMAKLAARPRRRRKRGESHTAEPTRPIMQLASGEVDLHRAPRAAVEDFLEHREPPREEARPRRRHGRESRRNREHRWMLEKERP
jgi:hypothetical protein